MTTSVQTHPRVGPIVSTQPAYQAYQILRVGFTVAPLLAGLDKFSQLMVNWEAYLAPTIASLSPVSPHSLMLAIGVVEIVAALLVWVRPRIGAYVVMGWIWAIIINLLMIPGYYDIVLRDFGLSLGALALARLSREYSSV